MLEYILLIVVGFIAGFVNTIAGGGTLLTMPMLIFMGLPPSVANGTNRVAILIQTAIGVKGFLLTFVKNGCFLKDLLSLLMLRFELLNKIFQFLLNRTSQHDTSGVFQKTNIYHIKFGINNFTPDSYRDHRCGKTTV